MEAAAPRVLDVGPRERGAYVVSQDLRGCRFTSLLDDRRRVYDTAAVHPTSSQPCGAA